MTKFIYISALLIIFQSCSIMNNSTIKLIDNTTGGLNISKNDKISIETNQDRTKEILTQNKIIYEVELNAEGFSSININSFIYKDIEFEITLNYHNNEYCGFNLFFKNNKKASKFINNEWEDNTEGAQIELYKEWLQNEMNTNDKNNTFHQYDWGKIKVIRNGMLGIAYISCKVKANYPRVYYLSGW